MKIEDPNVTMEDLAVSEEGYEEFDLVLARDGKDLLSGELARTLGEMQEANLRKTGKPLRGRQMFWWIYQGFAPKKKRADTRNQARDTGNIKKEIREGRKTGREMYD